MTELIKVLLREGIISQGQLNDARDKQLGAKKPLQELLVEMGFVKEKDLIRILSGVFKAPIFNPDTETIERGATRFIPYEKARQYGVFPVRKESNALILATSDPTDLIIMDDIRSITKLDIRPVLATKSQINQCLEKYYDSSDEIYDLLKNFSRGDDSNTIKLVKEDDLTGISIDIANLREDRSPVVKLINLLIRDAIFNGASDIHIEPQEREIVIRERIDGELREVAKFPKKIQLLLISRIKIMADLDIAEQRKPQDGRVKISVDNRKVDLRISLVPMIHGEKAQMRILDPKTAKIELDKIGFEKDEIEIFKEAILRPQGMVLVTGPTGSGKTSTLYAALNFVKGTKKNIITIEDPVEYTINGVNQIQVNPVKDVTFSTGLRSILRQDPNIILVGEIRDNETAEIAFRASLTGHLVFSTVHTNSAIASITRLRDIGLESYLITSSLNLIVAQRLIKLICPHCKEVHTPDKELLDEFSLYFNKFDINKFYKGKGCQRCNYTGYHGRTAIFELLQFNETIREMVTNKATEDIILKEAKKSGLRSLAESGIEKVAAGLTSLEEIGNISEVWEADRQLYKVHNPGENIRVLVAEDDEDILKVLEKRLCSAGFEVIKARDGEELVERAIREKPDIIITDVTMPKMNGFEATGILKKKLDTAMIPIIMLTAREDKESELKGIEIGADDYLTKPFDKDKVVARIKMILRRKD